MTLALKAKAQDDIVPIMLPILSRLLKRGYTAKLVQKVHDILSPCPAYSLNADSVGV